MGIALACSDSTAPVPDCSGQVEITVGGGTAPAIAWSPVCRLSTVLVELEVEGTDQWIVSTPEEDGIEPPLTYGALPEGAVEIDDPTPLESGTGYRVVLFVIAGAGGGESLLGSEVFTP